MGQTNLTLNERKIPWVLVVEPWALAFDVQPDQRVRVDITTSDGPFDLEIDEVEEGGVFLAFFEPKFTIRIGEDEQKFDFG